jgi:S1-C subfamily serine protease
LDFGTATRWNCPFPCRHKLQLQNVERGVAIVYLEAGSAAANIGFRRGDVVEEVNGKRIGKTRELERLSSVPNSTWAVTVLRGGQRLSVVLGHTSPRPPR